MAQFVDWDLAASTAAALGKTGPSVTPGEAAHAVAQLRDCADRAADHVREFSGLVGEGSAPTIVVDRRDWALANIAGLRRVIAPLLDRVAAPRPPGPLAEALGARAAGVQAGTVLAFLSGRVLGQFDVFGADPGRLLLVAPNIVDIERRLGVAPDDFRLWVCLHEVTHRAQFTAVPWLRAHFLAEVEAYVDAGEPQGDLVRRVRDGFAAAAESVRRSDDGASLIDVVQTPAQRKVLERITALMTLVEGHAEFVMDGVGPGIIPTVREIRARFNHRRESGNSVQRLVRRLIGVDAKMRQYRDGRRFVSDVVDEVGVAGLNQVWRSPQTLPSLAELADPPTWIARVAAEPSSV